MAAFHPQRITRMFCRAAWEAVLLPIRLHDLRHGAATLAHLAGADIKAIQQLLRHASVAITADTYTLVLQEASATLAEGIASVVPRLRGRGLVRYSRPHDGPSGTGSVSK